MERQEHEISGYFPTALVQEPYFLNNSPWLNFLVRDITPEVLMGINSVCIQRLRTFSGNAVSKCLASFYYKYCPHFTPLVYLS